MASDQAAHPTLDAIGDAKTRKVLATLNVESFSAKELSELLDMSSPTIYRRLDQLEEHDLVTKNSVVSTDGNHYSVYSCNFENAVITLHRDEYVVRVRREDASASKLAELWDVIQRTSNR